MKISALVGLAALVASGLPAAASAQTGGGGAPPACDIAIFVGWKTRAAADSCVLTGDQMKMAGDHAAACIRYGGSVSTPGVCSKPVTAPKVTPPCVYEGKKVAGPSPQTCLLPQGKEAFCKESLGTVAIMDRQQVCNIGFRY